MTIASDNTTIPNQPLLLEAIASDPLPQVLHIDERAMQDALDSQTIAIDCETQTRWVGTGPEGNDFGLSYPSDVIAISFAWRDELGGLRSASFYCSDGDWPGYVCDWLYSVFAHRQVVMHNTIFDCRQLSKLTLGTTPVDLWDTMIMERLLVPKIGRGYGLADVARSYGLTVPDSQLKMKGKRAALHAVELKALLEYASADASLTYQVYEAQQAQATTEALRPLVDWEIRALYSYAQMTARGVRLNISYVKDRITELLPIVEEAAARLNADGLHNPASGPQKLTYIYETKGIPKPEKGAGNDVFFTASGNLSASSEALEELITRAPEHAEALKDLITYLDGAGMIATLRSLLDHAALDGRVHSLTTIGTETGRRASQHPNLQNLKMAGGGDIGNMTGVLLGDDDQHTLVEVDFSNAENWLSAMLSGDNQFAAACASSDFHSAMAQEYFGEIWQQADKDTRKHLRRQGKTITFGTAYGMGVELLAQRLKITASEAKNILIAKDAAFPKVAHAKQVASAKGRAEGVVRLWSGRIVPVDTARAYTAWNFVCQGGVGEMIKRAIVLITEEFEKREFKSRIALDMHDALILSVYHPEWNEALSISSEIMESVIPAKLNERTSPPIQWIARPDLEENRVKWGRFQAHPETAESPGTAVQGKDGAVLILEFPDLGDLQLKLPDLGQYNSFAQRCEALPEGYQRELEMFFSWAVQATEAALSAPITVQLPSTLGGGVSAADMANYRKALWQWIKIANKELPATPFGDGILFSSEELTDLFQVATETITLYKRRIEVLQRYHEILTKERRAA